jgi:DNA-binding transcriptional LysR family regulator
VTLDMTLSDHRSVELGICAVYPTRKHVSPTVRRLIDDLVNAMKARDWQHPAT